MNLLRLCDVHNIPITTNIATAEVLIHGTERGDLDWRNIVNQPQLAECSRKQGCLPGMHKTNGPLYDFIHTGGPFVLRNFQFAVMYSRATEAAAHAGDKGSCRNEAACGRFTLCKIHRSVRQKHNACKRCGEFL